jgi:hypothetical protein
MNKVSRNSSLKSVHKSDSQKNFAQEFAYNAADSRVSMEGRDSIDSRDSRDGAASSSSSGAAATEKGLPPDALGKGGVGGLAAGLSSVSIDADAEAEAGIEGVPLCGSTYPLARGCVCPNTLDPPRHSFQACLSSSFSTRVGPNYTKTGAKEPAGPCLYEACGME